MTLRGRGSGWRWGTITPIIPLGEITCQRDLCPFCVGPYLDLSRVGFQQPTTDPCSSDRPQGRLSIAHSRQIRAIYHPDPIGITSFRPGLVKDLISHGRAPSTKGATALPAGLIIVAATSCAISLDTYDTKGRRIACESQFDRDEHTAIPPMVRTNRCSPVILSVSPLGDTRACSPRITRVPEQASDSSMFPLSLSFFLIFVDYPYPV